MKWAWASIRFLASKLIAVPGLDSSISHPEHQAGRPSDAFLEISLPAPSSVLPASHMHTFSVKEKCKHSYDTDPKHNAWMDG